MKKGRNWSRIKKILLVYVLRIGKVFFFSQDIVKFPLDILQKFPQLSSYHF